MKSLAIVKHNSTVVRFTCVISHTLPFALERHTWLKTVAIHSCEQSVHHALGLLIWSYRRRHWRMAAAVTTWYSLTYSHGRPQDFFQG